MFRANPQPTAGQWHIGNVVISIGEEAYNDRSHFQSSFFSDGDLEGEYQVTLNFTIQPRLAAEKQNLLTVTNDLGMTNYTLNLTNLLDAMQVKNTDLVEHSSPSSKVSI